MAALCEEFTLCGLLSGADGRRQQDRLQGVEEAGERDTVLVTDSGRTVTLYKVSDQRPLGSWAVRQGQRITCPAVYNHSTGEYVVVHNQKVLRVWKHDDVNFDKVFKATLSADVCRVHSIPDSEPLVLFRGGALRYLDALLADPQQEIETVVTEDEKIIWSQVLVDGGQPVFIFITEKRPDWFVYTWRPAFSASQRWRLQPATDDSTVLDLSAVMKNRMVSLVILYSSGHVRHAEVSLAPSDQELELPVSPLLQLPEAADTGALIILHDSYVATLTPCTPQQKHRLCIWNTSFQTLQDCKEFSQKTWGQLWTHDGKLYIPHANSLLVLRYTCQPSCLASALGKGRATQKSDPAAVAIVNWEALTGKAEQPKPAATRKTSRTHKPQSSGEETSSYLEVLSDIQAAPESQIPTLVQRVYTTAKLAHFQIAICSVTQGLVTRCQSQTRFYPQSSIIKLIESGVLSYSLCPGLMTLCLEKRDVQALHLCLVHFVDIPEGVLCSCLKAFLSVSEDILSKAIIDTKSASSYIHESPPAEEAMEPEPVLQNGFSSPIAEDDSSDVQMLDKSIPRDKTRGSPVGLRRAVLLNSVLTSPFSENFLLPHLKDLPSEQVILFLSYLHYLYKKCSESVKLNLPGEERLSITQVVDWMNLILDANFTVLVLLPKAKPLLRTLQMFVRSQMKFFSELNKIEGSLSELQKLQRSSRGCGRYSIEVLELY